MTVSAKTGILSSGIYNIYSCNTFNSYSKKSGEKNNWTYIIETFLHITKIGTILRKF